MGLRPNILAALTAKSAPSYLTGAVNFDGTTWLSNATTMGAADSYTGLYSAWFWQASQGDLGQSGATAFLATGDPGDQVVFILTNDPAAGFGFDASNTIFDHNNPTLNPPGINVDQSVSAAPVGSWFNFLLAWDTTNDPALYAAYINDVPISFDSIIANQGNGKVTYSLAINYTVGVYNGGAPAAPSILGYGADMFFSAHAPGIVQNDSTILTADRRKFISASGKPVDLTAAIAAYNPQMVLRRAPTAAASTFGTNLGTGGNFTITGTLTSAPSSPSD